jgi:hypothetical protein
MGYRITRIITLCEPAMYRKGILGYLGGSGLGDGVGHRPARDDRNRALSYPPHCKRPSGA